MTINELLKILEEIDPKRKVYFNFCCCIPTEIASWRGCYYEPALGWEPTQYSSKSRIAPRAPEVRELMTKLNDTISGRTYEGWKGGDYRYTGDEPLHIDNRGDCTLTGIDRIDPDCNSDVFGEKIVVIYTKIEEE